MRNVLKSLPAIAAFLLPGLGAVAAPTIVSPADYATISTMSASLKSFKGTSAMVTYTTYKSSTSGNATRTGYAADYATNSAPVKLVWSGTSGSCAVKIWRTHKDTAATPVVSTNVTGTSFLFYDPEVGRNYTWTVQNGSATATGHFFTERDAPRILYTSHDGFHICNGRDQGGWTTSSGKVVKQGLVYRSREFEFYAPHNEAESEFYPIPYLRDTLGIRLDVDLRAKQTVIDAYMPGYPTAWNSISLSPIAPTVPRYHSEDDCGTSFPSYSEAVTVKANRIAVWHTFAKFCDSSNFPILYHCSHGKDRTGTLGYILLGVLGVSRDDLNRDYGLSWYAYSTWTLSSWTIDNVYNSLNSRYSSASTLADKCEAYLKECASDAGVAATTAQNMIDTYKTLMLEDPETNDGTDAFAYTDFYFRRAGGGGSFGSEDSSGRLNYMFKTLTSDATSNKRLSSEMGYGACYCFWPTKSLPYARPVCGYEKAGKIVISAADAATESTGPYNFKVYFTTDGHTMADRTVIEQRAGIGDFENVDLYFTTYDSSQLGENGLSLPYVYSGTAAIEVWANATMRVRDLRDMSQKHKTSKKYKTYVKFPSGNCDNARFEVLETDVGAENLLGWFTGGQAGTTQHLKVGGAILQFNATGKTSGVDGALVLEFELGSANTTSTAAMLKIAGALKVNAGSSIVVDAGGKGAGTYKLVQAGTLTDNANLPANATVTNCKSGYYGTVVRSGNNLNLVIAAGTPPSPDIAITAAASYVTYPSPKFTVSGTVAVGEGTTTATLHYTLGGGTEQTLALALGADGSFSADIPYASAGDSLVWRVIAENVNGGATATGATAATTTARAADSAATTYVWTGAAGDGKWTTIGNWTSASTTAYGYPANGTYATAEFPASLTDAFTCTVDQNVAVQSLYVLSPNIRLVLADKTLTVNGNSGSYTSYSFGNVADGNPSIAFSGANAALVSAKSSVRANYGYTGDAGTASGVCTVQYTVPASGWTSTAPVRATGTDSKALFYNNVKLSIDATALGVPAAGETKTVYLASGTDAPGVYQLGTVEITCAAGAQGAVSVSNNKLVLSVTSSAVIQAASIEALLADKPYTGANQTSGLADTSAYTFTADAGGTDAGDYTVVVAPNAGYTWDDESTAARTFTWSIVPAQNAWTTTPSITKGAWTTDATPGVLTAGATQFGPPAATIAKDGGAAAAFSGTLPTEAGEYVITYTSAATANWLAPSPASQTVSFIISEPTGLSEVAPPTVQYASGTVFTANDTVQKPTVTPEQNAGYTVSWGATDWTSAGTHTLTISLNDGYCWEGGPTAPLAYTYTFSTISYTAYYNGKSVGTGRYQSSSRWFKNAACSTKWNAYPDAYTAHAVCAINPGVASVAVMDDSLVAKAGKFTVNGLMTVCYGTLQFQNKTVTPVPLWTTETGVSTLNVQNLELAGAGTGYFDIHANASNVFSSVSAPAGIFVRFNTSDAAGATLVVSADDGTGLTTLGWFEGGTAATTPRLVVDGGRVNFTKADAVSGVAGPLAIAVALGDHNKNATPISVAGTLNVNAGSTLAVDAASLPAGTYAILSAGTLNDSANLAANGVVTGLGEGLVGALVRSENAIRLVISPEAPDDPTPVLTEIAVPAARTGLVYDGAEKTGVLPGTGYTLADNVETGAGDYTATATLDEGYCWTGGSTDPAAIAWSIAKAQNAWTTEPAITKATWAVDGEAGVLTPAVTQFGAPSATIAKDGGAAEAFSGTLPTEAGEYVITYTSAATANWLAPTPAAKTLSFSIVEPESETFKVTLFDEHPEWGYKVEGLGVAHDETALVFTNQNASSMAWTVPSDLADVQFLVVGGGGGGGADYNPGSGSAPFLGGGGGGGGGVVTGVVSTVIADTVFSIKVGAGGAGGICNKTQVNGGFGASYAGSDSTVSLGGVAVLTAFGGGNDKGTTSSSAKSGRVGGTGGSDAGSRGGYGTAQGAPTRGSIAASFASQLAGYGVLGNVGGSGNTGEQYWGYYSASGGGGGATTAGGTPTDYSTGGTGGEGLASDITGTLRVYGSGGGGGTISGNLGGAGGTGAGSGNIDTGNGGSGQDALANQGGGGGGGGRSGNGGKGGSGIVVLRFRVPSTAPAMPSVSGEDVAPAEVFTKAREAKSIVYPSEPTVAGDVGSQVISFGGIDVDVPDYYTASKSGNVVTLALNENAKPVITDEDETPGIAIVDGKVHIHLGNVKGTLYYTQG